MAVPRTGLAHLEKQSQRQAVSRDGGRSPVAATTVTERHVLWRWRRKTLSRRWRRPYGTNVLHSAIGCNPYHCGKFIVEKMKGQVCL